MTTNETTAAAATAEAPATATKKKGMDSVPQRRLFDSLEAGYTALMAMLDEIEGAPDLPLIIAGKSIDPTNGEATIDPTVYDGQRTMLAILNEKVMKPKNATAKDDDAGSYGFKPRAIVLTPVPTLDAILADDTGKKWLNAIIETQLNNTAFRKLRKPGAILADGQSLLPLTLADFVTSETSGSNSGMTASFNELFADVNKSLETLSLTFKNGKPGKKAVLQNALESAAFARAMFPALEQPTKKFPAGLLVTWLQLAEGLAVQRGLDPAVFQHWLATRNEAAAQLDEDEAEEELDLSAVLAGLAKPAAAEPAADAAPAGE